MDESIDEEISSTGGRHLLSNAMTVSVHPLVIMNISEHATRLRAQNRDNKSIAVYGAILGNQMGRHVEMKNSFEIKFSDDPKGNPLIDVAFYTARQSQYQEVFRDMECVGWYTVDNHMPTDRDYEVHSQFRAIQESPIMLKLDPSILNSNKLPLTAYDCLLEPNGSSIKWRSLEWTLGSEQAERVGIEHVAQISTLSTASKTATNQQINGQLGAINMLQTKLELINDYVASVRNGSVPRDEEIIREIAQLVHTLPIMDSDDFTSEYDSIKLEAQMIAFVSTLTRTCGTLNELVTKMNMIITEKHGGPALWTPGRRCRTFPAV